jgi:hypothetical protein
MNTRIKNKNKREIKMNMNKAKHKSLAFSVKTLNKHKIFAIINSVKLRK